MVGWSKSMDCYEFYLVMWEGKTAGYDCEVEFGEVALLSMQVVLRKDQQKRDYSVYRGASNYVEQSFMEERKRYRVVRRF